MTQGDATEPTAIEGAKPIRAIVVDDSARWLKAICTFFESEPAIIVAGTARDGLLGLGLIETLRPQLVILDVNMPRMNGFEAARLIRARYPEVRILMTSADGDEATQAACIAQGAHAFLGKSDANEALLPAIFRLFGGSEAEAPQPPAPE